MHGFVSQNLFISRLYSWHQFSYMNSFSDRKLIVSFLNNLEIKGKTICVRSEMTTRNSCYFSDDFQNFLSFGIILVIQLSIRKWMNKLVLLHEIYYASRSRIVLVGISIN